MISVILRKSGFSLVLFEGASNLIGTGCGLDVALDAAKTFDSLVNSHSYEKRGNALRVTRAATDKLAGGNDAVGQLKVDLSCAGALLKSELFSQC